MVLLLTQPQWTSPPTQFQFCHSAQTKFVICDYAIEIFFNVINNVLSLQNIISRNKNGIMIEIYAALIFHLLTRIVIALAAQKTGQSIHHFSFERSAKLIKGFLLANIHLFFRKSLQVLDEIFAALINVVAQMGERQKSHPIIDLKQQLSP